MRQILRLVHFAGLILFLGSIITFIIISSLIEGASLEQIAFGRKIITSGTEALTLPGMWALAISGIWLGYLQYGVKQRYFLIKLVIILLIVLNAYVIIVPAANTATDLALRSLSEGRLLPAYTNAYLQETVFGAVNVLLTLSAAVVGVWKVGLSAKVPPPLT